MPETITVKISKDGSSVTMDAAGFTGGKCEEVIKKIAAGGLGEILESKKKPSYYATESSGIHTGH